MPKSRYIRELAAVICGVASLVAIAGCHRAHRWTFEPPAFEYQRFLQQVEYPDAAVACAPCQEDPSTPPPTLRNADELEYWPMSLEEAVQLALSSSEAIRQIGGRVVASPGTTSTVYDPAIQETDASFGPEAALAAFDAELRSRFYLGREEQKFNNIISGAGTNARDDDLGTFEAGISKTTAAGTQFLFQHITTYDRNNVPLDFQRFASVYDTQFLAGFRQPLLRGAGIEFNRIAGPGASPGVYRGILIARIHSDITLADFEASVRNLLRDVEQTYWELYFAYRDLDAKKSGRESALEIWRLEEQRVKAGALPPKEEAFAREQYYLAQAAVEDSLNGTSSTPGVFAADGRLRSLLGLPASDGRLIRPTSTPLTVDIHFDWGESLAFAQTRRVELRRQRWKVKQRELELVAARNMTRVQLDLFGHYRFRGYGDVLFGPGHVDDFGPSSAFGDLFQGDLQGWMAGLEMKTPFGNRLGHAALRNAELLLRREQALLAEQERQVSYELREAFGELDRAYAVSRSNYNRHLAARTRMEEERRFNDIGKTQLDLVLDAQRRAVEAEVAFHRAIVEHTLAQSQLQFARGTLLDSLQVYLAEGPWSCAAHASAAREAERFTVGRMPLGSVVPAPVSAGPYAQRVIPTAADAAAGAMPADPEMP